MRLSAELLNDVIPRFLRDGWQVNAHAIGDRADAVVLDAFEKAASEGIDLRELRPRIEHAQIMREGWKIGRCVLRPFVLALVLVFFFGGSYWEVLLPLPPTGIIFWRSYEHLGRNSQSHSLGILRCHHKNRQSWRQP